VEVMLSEPVAAGELAQVLLLKRFQVMLVRVGPLERNRKVESVNVVAAVPDTSPVALTVYVATNQFGRLKESVTFPFTSAVTSTLRDHVLPISSLTKM
jgi:hypothetical protein